MSTNRYILLSFDVEEFDIPLEYNHFISVEEQLDAGFKGLIEILPLINKAMPVTLFTTANFAIHYSTLIKELSVKNEIASHTFYHSSFKDEDLSLSRKILQNITGKEVKGLRMPRMKEVNMKLVAESGYLYDSSVNPTWIPGRYNNLSMSRKTFTSDGMIRIPTSVTPNFRIPLFWLSFKNMPYKLFLKIAIRTLKHDGYLSLYFHPWEFIDLKKYQIPGYIKRIDGKCLFKRLENFIDDISREGEFISMGSYLSGI